MDESFQKPTQHNKQVKARRQQTTKSQSKQGIDLYTAYKTLLMAYARERLK